MLENITYRNYTKNGITNLRKWLESEPAYPKVFWKSRNQDLTIAGAGCIFEARNWSEAESFLKHDDHVNIPLIGGIRFDSFKDEGTEWRDYGDFRLLAPHRWLVQKNGAVTLWEAPHSLLSNSSLAKSRPEIPIMRQKSALSAWKVLHGSALKNISSGAFAKVVIARQVPLQRSEIPKIHHLPESSGTYQFFFSPTAESFFYSQSPECLLHSLGGTMTIDCLGGTVWGEAKEINDLPARIIREHSLIHDQILARLYSSDIAIISSTSGVLSLRKINNVSHLSTPIRIELANPADALKIVDLLHPTAAVGGLPRNQALNFIREQENFDRGWYAAPVGCILGDYTEFAVGLRSILVSPQTATAFVGCGIVEGSDALMEWEETKQKLTSFLPETWITDK